MSIDPPATPEQAMSTDQFGKCGCSLGLTRCNCGIAIGKQPAIPTAALIPRPGQSKLAYVPAAQTDLRKLFAQLRTKQCTT